jgi:hypothetical protein
VVVIGGEVGEGVGDREGGIVQGVASAWEDMMSSMEPSPPGVEVVSSCMI